MRNSTENKFIKIILFNGPPGCGKDTIVDGLIEYFRRREETGTSTINSQFFKRQFKEGLYKLAKELHSLSDAEIAHYFEDNKEEKFALFNWLSPRQELIRLSEQVIKPLFGRDAFARYIADTIKEEGIYLFSDSGFYEEAQHLIDTFGKENVMLVRVYREGCDFRGDSRQYLSLDMFDSPPSGIWGIVNEGSKEALVDMGVHAIKYFLFGDK